MKHILVGIISILLIQNSSANCAEWKELETKCGSYCFNIVRPILDHTKDLQRQVNDFKLHADALPKYEDPQKSIHEKLDSIVKRMDEKSIQEKFDSFVKAMDQKLENQRNMIAMALQKQIDINTQQNIAKLQSMEHQFKMELESLKKTVDDQGKSIQNAIQKQTETFTKQNSDSQAKIESIKSLLQTKTESLEKKFDNQIKTTDTSLQKQVSNLSPKFDTLAKAESIKQLQVNFESLDKKLINQIQNILSESKNIKTLDTKLNEIRKLYEARKIAVKKPFRKLGSKYYYIENDQKINWFAAAHKCLEFGGHLASIQNLNEFNLLKANLKTHNDYWIDINDLSTEGVFLSATTGLRANYFNWHSGNPDNFRRVEHCGALWFRNNKHLMNDDNCVAGKLFICESENVN